MNAIIPFTFENNAVRVTDRSGDPWFILADVCRVLEIGNSRDAASRLDEDEKADVGITDTSSNGTTQRRAMTIINESGLWSLVLTSRKPEAKRFKKWITSEVLPTLRKTGRYAMPGAEAPPSPPPSALDLETAREWVGIVEKVNQIAGSDAARTVLERSPLLMPTSTTRPAPPQSDHSRPPPHAKADPKPDTRERPPRKPDTAALERRRKADEGVSRFLSDCTFRDPKSRVSAADLHEAYTGWCMRERIEPETVNAFGRSCRSHLRWRKSCGKNVYLGICLGEGRKV